MTIIALAVGRDRVQLVQDSGSFERAPPQVQTAVVTKIAVLPHARLMAGGCGPVWLLSAWQRQLLAGAVGDSLAEVTRHGPGMLLSLANGAIGAFVVAGLDGDRAGAILMQRAHGFEAERLRPGTLLFAPDTRDEPPAEPSATREQPPREDMPAEEPPPEDRDVDWTALRLGLIRGVRQQIAQNRVRHAPPYVSALMHPDGIDLRRFDP